MNNDVPMICDPVPWASSDILTVPYRLSEEQAAELKVLWTEGYEGREGSVLQMAANITIYYPEREEWPDAEFCAA
jgi:hypothetical protein